MVWDDMATDPAWVCSSGLASGHARSCPKDQAAQDCDCQEPVTRMVSDTSTAASATGEADAAEINDDPNVTGSFEDHAAEEGSAESAAAGPQAPSSGAVPESWFKYGKKNKQRRSEEAARAAAEVPLSQGQAQREPSSGSSSSSSSSWLPGPAADGVSFAFVLLPPLPADYDYSDGWAWRDEEDAAPPPEEVVLAPEAEGAAEELTEMPAAAYLAEARELQQRALQVLGEDRPFRVEGAVSRWMTRQIRLREWAEAAGGQTWLSATGCLPSIPEEAQKKPSRTKRSFKKTLAKNVKLIKTASVQKKKAVKLAKRAGEAGKAEEATAKPRARDMQKVKGVKKASKRGKAAAKKAGKKTAKTAAKKDGTPQEAELPEEHFLTWADFQEELLKWELWACSSFCWMQELLPWTFGRAPS